MKQYFLQGQTCTASFGLPPGWRVLNQTAITAEGTREPISRLVRKALDKPIGTPPLREIMKGKRTVAIIVDDPARPTPKNALLITLLDYLRECGTDKNDITIVIALGTHGALAESEIREVYGDDIYRDVKIVGHDCRAADLVSVGNLPEGGELKINRLVAGADVRISVGSLLPHPFAGFGGGAKAILPGVAAYETIRDHHIALMLRKGAFVGNTVNNPFLDEIREAGRQARLDFIVNAVFDANENVKDVVGGHFVDAHIAGAATCAKELGVRYDRWADVTLMSAFPYTDGPQILKPLATSNAITREGGVVILYASEIKGGAFAPSLLQVFDAVSRKAAGDPKKLIADHLRSQKPIIPGIQMDFNSALNMTLLYVTRTRMILVSDEADAEQAARIGFEYASSLQSAIDMVATDLPAATVNILPMGGVVMPIVPDHMRTSWFE